jgi:hypothetical protein
MCGAKSCTQPGQPLNCSRREGDSFLHEVSNTALKYFSSHHTTRRAIVFDLFFISEAGFFIYPYLLLSSWHMVRGLRARKENS